MGYGCGHACFYTHMQNANIGGGILEMFGFAFNKKKKGKHDSKIWLGGAKFLSSL